MEFQKNFKNFSVGFGEYKAVGVTGEKNEGKILTDIDKAVTCDMPKSDMKGYSVIKTAAALTAGAAVYILLKKAEKRKK